MSLDFNPERNSYLLMQTPVSMFRNKSFTIMGFISDITLEIDYTVIKVLVITFKNKDEVREFFDVYFMGEPRLFIDRYARVSDLIDVSGEMVISRQVIVDGLQIIKLSAKHAYLFRKYGNAYDQISELIKAEETDNEDLAF